jgi:hypothetical protein
VVFESVVVKPLYCNISILCFSRGEESNVIAFVIPFVQLFQRTWKNLGGWVKMRVFVFDIGAASAVDVY